MKIVFLASADEGIRWFTRYYIGAFPEGQTNARDRMATSLSLLGANPHLGRVVGKRGQRELSIPRTPFSLIYRIANDRIEILRVWDGRANPNRLNWLEEKEDRV
jgi:plasmid stabilization system protein ParE